MPYLACCSPACSFPSAAPLPQLPAWVSSSTARAPSQFKLSGFTVPRLKEICGTLMLPKSGLKKDLAFRIMLYARRSTQDLLAADKAVAE